MKNLSIEALTGYGSVSRVFMNGEGKASDETRVEIDFSEASFPEIDVFGENKRIVINARGSIERREILEAFRAVVKMLEQ